MGETNVVVDEGGVLARWADWQGESKRLRVAAIAGQSEATPAMFVADEVLVDPEERELIDELVGMGAAVVEQEPLLPPPQEMERRQLMGEFPMPAQLRFAEPPPVERAAERLTDLYRQHDPALGTVTVSSEGAARVAVLAGRLAAEGRRISLNAVGNSGAMPRAAPKERKPHGREETMSAFDWDAFKGRSRIADAWHLLESARELGAVQSLVWIAVLDAGFWLDDAGIPIVGLGEKESDFGGVVAQLNLLDERGAKAGGENLNTCSGDSKCPWHGNGVASAAIAAAGGRIGTSTERGPVARPVFFRSSLSESQVYRCLWYCAAWGLDVLNMSFTIKSLPFTSSEIWDRCFQFAAAHGVILVAGAGNDGEELPDFNVRPATRTPAVITVGALDVGDNALGISNYGSSVSVWAPGDNVPVAPDGQFPDGGTTKAGTSIATGLVSGVAAMIRAVDFSLDSVAVRQILADTAWAGAGRVSRGMDAHAALLRAMGGALPRDSSEPNNTLETAAELPPSGESMTYSKDPDCYKFELKDFSTVTVSLEWYPRLTHLSLLLHADDPKSRGPADMAPATGSGTTTLSGLLAPGTYRLQIAGSADTAYRLNVHRQPARVLEDAFEPNDSFETATKLVFEKGKGGDPRIAVANGPGTFDCSLHSVKAFVDGGKVINPDYFELDVPASSVFRIPTVTISDADLPLDVTLYDAARQEILFLENRREADIEPPPESKCFLKVSGKNATRYRITVRLRVDKAALPGALQEEVEIFPKWWGDPERRILDRVKHYLVEVGADRGDGTSIRFASPDEPVRIELLNLEGRVVRQAADAPGGPEIDTQNLGQGHYLLRLTREAEGGTPLKVRLLPPRR